MNDIVIQVISGGLIAAIVGLIGMFAKVKELDNRMSATEAQCEKESLKTDGIGITLAGLESTMHGFNEKLTDIKAGQDGMVDRLFRLLKGANND